MDKDELESTLKGEGAYEVVEQGAWVINLSTHHFDNHVVLNKEDLKFYRLEGYIRKAPTWLYDWSNVKLVEVTPVEKSVVYWKVVG